MRPLLLTHPVMTLDKELLFPAGTDLSRDIIAELAGKTKTSRRMKLNMFDTAGKDLLELVQAPPYNNIFHKVSETSSLLESMGEADFPFQALETLRYFKEYDYHTYRHQLMVFALSGLVARDMLSEDESINRLSSAGPLHDIGKICVPLEILRKDTLLSKAERSVLDNHSAAGYVLMSYYCNNPDCLGPVSARDHHERRDGSGKPTGKSLDNILIEIIAVCDIYDALISPRPYRPVSYDNRTAIEELVDMADKGAISMDIVKVLVARNRKQSPDEMPCRISNKKRGSVPEGNIYGMTED